MGEKRFLHNREAINKSINISFEDKLFCKKDTILKNRPLKITLIYLVFGVIWILFSDRILLSLSLNNEIEHAIEVLKGWIFVIITSLLVFSLLSQLFGEINKLFSDLVKSYQEKESIEEELRANFDELKEKENLLSQSIERYDLALECSNDIIWEWDIKENNFIVPEKAKVFFKVDELEKISLEKYIDKWVNHEDRSTFLKDLKNHLELKVDFYNSEYRIKRGDGEYIWILSKGRAIRDKNGSPIKMLGSICDITNKKNYEDNLYRIAHYDALTGLVNRKLFNEKLEKYIKESENFTILFLDLDDFKKVNDVFGHEFGDKLLISVSKLLISEVGENNLVSRVGGDEFLILLKDINDKYEVISLCERLIDIFKHSIKIEEKDISISSSIGIVMFPKDGVDTETLIKRADTALYKAKDFGKNTYSFFDKAMGEEVIRKAEIEKNLKDAVLDEEFEIYFQPQLNVITNKIVGFEALLRWVNPKLGRVSPAEFIPIAEDTGSIDKIGNWVLKKVCEQCKMWEDMNYNFCKISVNISVVQLQKNHFFRNVKKIIEDTKIKPEYLKFEITESVVITNFENNNQILNKLMDMGVEIALDDFGTGYSSINYLRNIPINTLKIDKSFVDNIDESKVDKVILKEIIKLANEISIDVIVEGVESKEQLEVLKEIGCTQIQGYYFSRPLPLCDIQELLKEYVN